MVDSRDRYFRRLRRLRRSVRRWSVAAGALGGATAVLAPYQGLGLPDAFWAAAAGGSIVLAVWRGLDLRAFAARQPPPAADAVQAAERARRRVETVIAALPGGGRMIAELRRMQAGAQVRGSAVAPSWRRLDRAVTVWQGLASRLGPPVESAVAQAAIAERSLRELAERAASVERGMRFTTGESLAALSQSHAALVAAFEDGVSAYEGLVAAAAAYVAEDGRATPNPSVSRLIDAAELLRGVASGYAELRADGLHESRLRADGLYESHLRESGLRESGLDQGGQAARSVSPAPGERRASTADHRMSG